MKFIPEKVIGLFKKATNGSSAPESESPSTDLMMQIGEKGSVQAFEEAVALMQGRYVQSAEMRALFRGAFQAFKAGSPEKLQLALGTHAQPFILSFDPYNPHALFSYTLLDITQMGGADIAADMSRALEKVEARQKEKALNDALSYAVRSSGAAIFIGALLKAGAKPAHKNSEGLGSHVLADAVLKDSPLQVVKMLVDHGAKFDEAHSVLNLRKKPQAIRRLLAMQEQFAAPLVSVIEPKKIKKPREKTQAELLDEIRQLREQVTALKGGDEKPAPATSVKPDKNAP